VISQLAQAKHDLLMLQVQMVCQLNQHQHGAKVVKLLVLPGITCIKRALERQFKATCSIIASKCCTCMPVHYVTCGSEAGTKRLKHGRQQWSIFHSRCTACLSHVTRPTHQKQASLPKQLLRLCI
jgi:hypothetical protein